LYPGIEFHLRNKQTWFLKQKGYDSSLCDTYKHKVIDPAQILK
jgi:hypothetical protein